MRASILLRGTVLSLCLLLLGTHAWAVAPRTQTALPNLDVHELSKPRPLTSAVSGVQGDQAVRARFGSAVQWRRDRMSGTPDFLLALGDEALHTGHPGARPELVARNFLRDQQAVFLLTPEEIATFETRQSDEVGGTELSLVDLSQRVQGMRVFGSWIRMGVSEEGAVVSFASNRVRPGAVPTRAHGSTPAMAVRSMAAAAGIEDAWTPVAASGLGEDGVQTFEAGPFDVPVRTERVWYLEATRLVPAWKGVLYRYAEDAVYQIVVEDGTGRLLHRTNILLHASTKGRVFEENPDKAPQILLPFADDTSNVIFESPAGWSAANLTAGNNVQAKDDRDGNDDVVPGTIVQATGAGTVADPYLFDFPMTGDPNQDLNLSTTNLFYFNNIAHDYFYELGFDEAAGNYQFDTFGRGGNGGDPVFADSQDGFGLPTPSLCNANFVPSPDGQPGRMNMFVFYAPASSCNPGTGSPRDSSLDGDIVIHEYVHGVSTRLVGGRDDASCLFNVQSGAMGEAWSDYFPGSFFDDPVLAEYSTGDDVSGIRLQSMDAPDGQFTYGQLCTLVSVGGVIPCEPHADGEIWAQMLWDMRERLRAKHGPELGTQIADRLVLTGMMLTPCNPSFLDARDAILAADQLLNGAENVPELWAAFAAAGMGWSASSTGAGDQEPQEAFDFPPYLVDQGILGLDRDKYLCDDTITVMVVDSGATNPSVTLTTTSGDSVDVSLTGSGGAFRGTVTFQVAPPAADAILQAAAEGETITARYIDSGGTERTDTATADCTADVQIIGVEVLNESCDDDSLPGYPTLPKILDADETVTLRLRFANAMEGRDLAGVFAQLTSAHPSLQISPATPVFLRTMEGPAGTAPGREIVLDFVIEAVAPLLPSPNSADLTLTLTSPTGEFLRSAGGDFTIPLNYDYVEQAGMTTEDFETGGAGWILSPPGGPPQNQWGPVTCNSHQGAGAFINGTSDCDNYSDNQSNPWTASKPLEFPPGSDPQAIRINRLEYWHDVRLGFAGFPGVGDVDADAMIVGIQNDPIQDVDASDLLGLLTENLALYMHLPNTTALIDQLPIPQSIKDRLVANEPTGWKIENQIDPFQLATISTTLDTTTPIRVVWTLVPDLTDLLQPCPLPGICDRAEGQYYLDDLLVEYNFADRQFDTDICTPRECMVAANIDEYVSPALCPGDAVVFDAGSTGVLNCPVPIEYVWTDGQGGVTNGSVLNVNPVVSSDAYTLDVICPAPGFEDCRDSATARAVVICDALADVTATNVPAVVCPGDNLILDAGNSMFEQCTNEAMEFRWSDVGGPLGAFSQDPQANAIVPASSTADYTLEVQRLGDEGCSDAASLQVPVDCDIVSAALPVADQPVCIGTDVTLEVDTAATALNNCTGSLEYQWSGGNIAAPAYSATTSQQVTVDADTTFFLDVRRDDWAGCEATQISVDVLTTDGMPTGSFANSLLVTFEDRPTEELHLEWTGSTVTPDTYVVHRSENPTDLSPANVTVATEIDRLSGAGEISLDLSPAPTPPNQVIYYRVFTENFCTGELLDL